MKTYIEIFVLSFLMEYCHSRKTIRFMGFGKCYGRPDDERCTSYTNKRYYCPHSWMQKNCCHFCDVNQFIVTEKFCKEFKCPKEGDMVCATNQRTYRNRCELRKAIYCQHMKIKEAYEGYCLRYPGERSCSTCVQFSQPVCGSNGQTYRNDCFLQNAISCYGLKIRFLYRGVCLQDPIKCPIKCPKSDHSYVCATDGKTYTRCELENAVRCNRRPIKSFYGGWCL